MVIFHMNHHFPMVFPWFSHGFPTVLPNQVGLGDGALPADGRCRRQRCWDLDISSASGGTHPGK